MENLFVLFKVRACFCYTFLLAMSNLIIDAFANQLRQSQLDVMGRLFPVLPMAIADTKVMPEIAPVQIGCQNEAVLVNLVWVVWYVPYPCCKRILSYNISLYELWLDVQQFIIMLFNYRLLCFSGC